MPADAAAIPSKSGADLTVLRSMEMNLNPLGEGDMSPESLLDLDLVLASFHSSLRVTQNQTARYLAALRNPHLHILGHPRGRIYNFRAGLKADWRGCLQKPLDLIRRWKLTAIPTGRT
jgi:histidinol phosphatase-like PHP family hydrolase